MASPTLDSYCCALSNDSIEPTKLLAPYFRSPTYTTTCLVFACFGVVGASYQVSLFIVFYASNRVFGVNQKN